MARLGPTQYRIPICQINGVVTYREVDLRAGGDDPLMRWIQSAADWEITDLRWDEKLDQPGELTYRGETLWDETTDGEVYLECQGIGGSGIQIYVRARFRPKFTGVVSMGGIEWRAFPVGKDPGRKRHGDIVDAVTTGNGHTAIGFANNNNVAIGPLALADLSREPEAMPYRTPDVPIPVAAQTIVAATCTGVIEQAFKDSIEGSIRRVFRMLSNLNRNRT